MHILLIFLDGVGIGADDPEVNPFSVANTPTLLKLTNGMRWVHGIGRQTSNRTLFIPTDPRLDIAGRPQSGTGHATIITGKNIPQMIGEHYGPKPNADTREIIQQGSFFSEVVNHGKTAALITAYPPSLIYDIERGKRLPSGLQQAALNAGLRLRSMEDLQRGDAISADWTGSGWHQYLGYPDIQLRTPEEGGKFMVELSRRYDFTLFSHTMTDYIGHRGTLQDGVTWLETFDRVMSAALDAWDDSEGLIIITSDHGNMEVTGDRHHTLNDVPTVVIGDERHCFAKNLHTLADIAPGMQRVLTVSS